MSGGWIARSAGSSPLARGLLEPRPVNLGGARIIPARAGFTAKKRAERLERTDHPRSRGVYAGTLLVGRGWLGSSPLARGLRQVV